MNIIRQCKCCQKDISTKRVDAIYCSKQCLKKDKKDSLREQNRIYRFNNKNKRKQYYLQNSEKLKQKSKEYYAKNKESVKKSLKTEQILGCTFAEFKDHIEQQMPIGKSIKDLGQFKYHIDHNIPLAKANTKEEVIKLCHYTNLQPLWWEDNLMKKDKQLTLMEK